MHKYLIILITAALGLTACSEQPTQTMNTPLQEVTISNTIPTISTEETLRMGIVELSVENLALMTNFYANTIGLELISMNNGISNLGSGKEVFLRLIEEKGLRYPNKNEAGLYHTAILYSNRKDLASQLYTILSKNPERYDGSSDHSVSEAFYFTDPEGNGLELYYDRPRTEWKYDTEGRPTMGSTHLDTVNYIERYRYLPQSGGSVQMGHIHLKVGDIHRAKNFYEDILIFDEINNMDTALFVSRDGYHHQVGMNVWESSGATKRDIKTYGLRSYELIYNPKIYSQIKANLNTAQILYEEKDGIIVVDDPWGNTIKIRQY